MVKAKPYTFRRTTKSTTTITTTATSTTPENTRTTPPPNIFVDGFIIGNINRNQADNNLPRNELSRERPKKPDLSSWVWMDPDKQEALAYIESEMADKHNIDGVRPMFEFSFDDEAEDDTEEEHLEHLEHDQKNNQVDHRHDNPHHGQDHMESEHGIHQMEHHHDNHSEHHDEHHHPHHGEHHEHHDQGSNDLHMDHHGSQGLVLPPLPANHEGIEATSNELKRAEKAFVTINNDLGLNMFKATLEDPEHGKSNLIFSPLSATTLLAMVFLGARGVTSWQINELLRLDEMITFNPHLMYRSITDDLVSDSSKGFISACVKQMAVDKVRFLIRSKD